MRISEVVVGQPIDNLSDAQMALLVANCHEIGNLPNSDISVYLSTVIPAKEYYFVGNPDILSLLALAKTGKQWHMASRWTSPLSRRQGLSKRLFLFVLREVKGTLYGDNRMSPDAILATEKMIASGEVQAYINDREAKTVITYDPINPDHQKIPMYSSQVAGIDRPPIPVGHTIDQKIWIFR